jgi:hypothetical protein
VLKLFLIQEELFYLKKIKRWESNEKRARTIFRIGRLESIQAGQHDEQHSEVESYQQSGAGDQKPH